jgi:hypothetical protein
VSARDAQQGEFEAFEQALAAAQSSLAAGAALERVLADVPPALRDEVASSLVIAGRVEALRTEPSPEFAADLEARFLAAVDERAHHTSRARESVWGRAWHTRVLRLTGLVIGVGVLLGGGSTAAVQASMSSIPGDTLYPVKEAREAVEGFLARGTSAELRAGELQLGRRTAELQGAIRRQAPPRVVVALEARVVASTEALVEDALEAREAGDAAAPERAQRLLRRVQAVTSDLSSATESPEVARTLRRLGLYLDGRVRALEAPETRPDAAPLRPR